jgi:signal transduction histidine kinase/ActR/RegA family two-component response regulator
VAGAYHNHFAAQWRRTRIKDHREEMWSAGDLFQRGWSFPYLGRRAAALLAAASLALLILVGVLAALMVERVNSEADWVTHSLQVEAKVTELLGQTQDLKIGERGYVLTAVDTFLAPYQSALARIPASLNQLRSLVSDNPGQIGRVDRMRTAINDVMAESARPVELTRQGDTAGAVAVVKSGRGLQVMDDFRAAFDGFYQAENDLLGMRLAAEKRARTLMLALVITGLATAAIAAFSALALNGVYIRDLHHRSEELARETRERKEVQAILVQTQKMESIGLLAGGIAHDFNNLMTIVIGNLDSVERRLARSQLEGAAAISRPITAALQGARRAASLTQRLLAFSRQQVLAPQQVDLNRLVAGLSDMLTRTVGETVAIETIQGSGLWPTFVDASQLENAIVNLVVNARDAMPKGGQITIETANAFLDEAYCRQFGDVTPGQYVLLSVTDTGTGISPENLNRVLEPFFTTKDAPARTGLGLAMIHGFVKQSKGHVRIYSELGHGTTAKIYLPRMDGAARVESAPPAVPGLSAQIPRARPCEVVLVVEDDDGVRESTVALLEDLGYSVLAARDGVEALAQLRKGGRIDILFTDVVLPRGMNGRMLSQEAAVLRPDLPVLFTTGYARNAIIHDGRLDAGVQFIAKPYTQEEVAHKLRAVIDSLAKA